MKQETQLSKSAVEPTTEGKLNLGRWLGRHEALDMVARSCSAVDTACLKKIREDKLYLDIAPNWDQFCKTQLGGSRKRFDSLISRLDEFGPAYFDLSRLTRVTVEEYRQLAPAVSAEGVQVDGEVVAIAPENQEKLAAAVAEVRKKRGKVAAKKSFESVLEACEAAAALIEEPPCWPDETQKLDLAIALYRMRRAGEELGVVTVEVRV